LIAEDSSSTAFQVISENQEVLKQKYNTAKAWATEVNSARDHINALKERIAQLRVERAAQGLVGSLLPTGISLFSFCLGSLFAYCADNNSGDDAEIESLMNEMQQYQTAYKEKFVALKGVKCTLFDLLPLPVPIYFHFCISCSGN
jgi:ubiquinone biosynthesis protein UbiJ